MRRVLWHIIFFCLSSSLISIPGSAQKIIITSGTGFYELNASSGYCSYSLMNVPTCFTKPQTGPFSITMIKDTIYYNNLDGELYMSVLNSPTSCIFIDTGFHTAALTINKSGILFLIDYENDLITYDPHKKIKTNLGKMNYSPSGDLVFWNNQLVMASYQGLITVNTSRPDNSVLFLEDTVFGFWGLANVSSTCNRNHLIGFSGKTVQANGIAFVVDIDMGKKSFKTLCRLPNYAADAASIEEFGGVSELQDTISSVVDTSYCQGSPAKLDAGYYAGASYVWDDNSTEQTRNVNIPGKYWVTINDSRCILTDTIDCNFINSPKVYLPHDTTGCISEQMLLSPQILFSGLPPNSYNWQNGSAQDSFIATKAGLYILNSTNVCGTSIDSVYVSFADCSCTFFIANAFTPNNDGINDIFTPTPKCTLNAIAGNYKFSVFNRFGQLLFSSGSVKTGWDGRFNGVMQPAGTYVWVLQYADNRTGKMISKNGTIVLIR